MEELLDSTDRVEKGVPLTPELDNALFHGSSIGGARPKALIEDQDIKYIAKFSSGTDLYSVVKAKSIAGNNNLSQLKVCLEASHYFLLPKEDARSIFEHIESVNQKYWGTVCEEAQLSEIDKKTALETPVP